MSSKQNDEVLESALFKTLGVHQPIKLDHFTVCAVCGAFSSLGGPLRSKVTAEGKSRANPRDPLSCDGNLVPVKAFRDDLRPQLLEARARLGLLDKS